MLARAPRGATRGYTMCARTHKIYCGIQLIYVLFFAYTSPTAMRQVPTAKNTAGMAAELRPQQTQAKRETSGRNRALLAGAACTWARSSAVTNSERSKPGLRCMCNCVLRRRNLAHGSGRSVSKKQNINALYATVYLMCARAHCVTACGSTRCAREQTG